jgi:hypothetical protein
MFQAKEVAKDLTEEQLQGKPHILELQVDDVLTSAECKEAFRMFDKDKNGVISLKELADVMRILNNNPTEAEINNLMADLDKNGNHACIIHRRSCLARGPRDRFTPGTSEPRLTPP